MEDFDIEQELVLEFKLTKQQAKFCVLVAGGTEPIDAVKDTYSYTNITNAYGQLKTLHRNPKIDSALKYLGMNLKDKFEKEGVSLLHEMKKLSRNAKSEQIRYNALKTLMEYNPELQTYKRKDSDDMEETDIEKRLKEEYFGED